MNKELSRWKAILVIAWPLIIANSFWNLQLTIDRVFLGMFSTEALGAAMAVNGVFWVPMALLQQTASYLTTFVAQYYGAGESKKIGECVWQAVYVSVVGGIAFIGLNLFSGPFFAMVGHAPATQALEVEYFNALSPSALPAALVAAISGFYTGLGRTQMVIWLNFIGLILNVVFDYLLIFGNFGFPELGVAGAGYATAIANYGAAAFGFFLILNRKNDSEYGLLRHMKVNWSLMKQYLKYGLPAGAQWALEGLAFTAFLINIGTYPLGEAALAASSIAVTVMMLSVLPSMGVAQAVMTLVGQNLGNKNPSAAEQATKDGIKIACIYMAVVATTFWFAPGFYLTWFRNDQNPELWAQVAELAPRLLAIIAVYTVFDSIYFNVSFALKGAGDTKFVSLVALLVPWPLMVLPSYLVSGWSEPTIWAWRATVVYGTVSTLILYLRFRQGRWKTMSVIDSVPLHTPHA